MASRKELEALIILAGKIDPSLTKAFTTSSKQMTQFGKASKMAGDITRSAFKMVSKSVAIGAAAIGVGLVAIAKQGLDLASDLTEVQNVVDVTFGKGAGQVNAFAKSTLKSFGLSELSAKQYTGTLGALMKSSGVSSDHLITMSENLTGLSGDFASFYNLDPAEAFEKIKSGISGETEPLKALGINMSVANLEAYALSKGIKTAYSKMSQGDQTMMRYNYLLEQSADAQGDFARTQDSYANQQRLFQEGFKQLSGTIMSAALPAFTSIFKKGNELIDSFASSPEKVAGLQNAIKGIADKAIEFIPKAIEFVKDLGSTIVDIVTGAKKVYQFISKNWSVIAPAILGIVAAMAAWKAITLGMKIYKGVMMAIKAGTVLATAAQWAMNSAVLANPMTWIIVGIVAAVALLIAGIVLIWKNWDAIWGWIIGLWESSLLPFFQGIGTWFSDLGTGIVDGFKLAWGGIETWFMGIFEGVKGTFKGFINMAIGGINKLIGGLNKIQFKLPEWAGGQEFGINIPMIPAFAKGGFTNQPSIFGEAGPEAAIPLKRTPRSLSLLSKTASALGVNDAGSGGANFSLTVNVSGEGGGSIKSQIGEATEDFFDRCDNWWESKRRVSFN